MINAATAAAVGDDAADDDDGDDNDNNDDNCDDDTYKWSNTPSILLGFRNTQYVSCSE